MFRVRDCSIGIDPTSPALLTAEPAGPQRRARRRRARARERRVRVRFPSPLEGGYSNRLRALDVYSIRQPLGVRAGITPFNFPAMVPMWMFANAIACGNTFGSSLGEGSFGHQLRGRSCCTNCVPTGFTTSVHGDKVSPSTGCSAPPTSPPSASWVDGQLRATSTRPALGTASVCSAGRGQKPHGGAARRRHRHGGRRRVTPATVGR